MKIMADWIQHLHNHRKRELGLIFSKCPERLFQEALELGAGDGFQSGLLTRYASKIISTDLNPDILKGQNGDSIEYRICNAEEIDKIFDRGVFDLVFSSNLLEHLPDPGRALDAIYNVLKDNGITIHVMPNPFWKFCTMLLRMPYICINAIEKMAQKEPDKEGTENRLKARDKRKLIHDILVPRPHGASSSNIKEFYLFSKARWKKQFKKANLDLIKIIKGPVASGYGFGLDWLRYIMEGLGFTSEYIYIAIKKGQDSCYRHYFDN